VFIRGLIVLRLLRLYCERFLRGSANGEVTARHPWVIAHALDDGGAVVTHEVLVSSDSMRVKIPNVCAHFGVGCIRAYEAFEKLGLRLSL
jgi:Domain of unknown function (DUF4411)